MITKFFIMLPLALSGLIGNERISQTLSLTNGGVE